MPEFSDCIYSLWHDLATISGKDRRLNSVIVKCFESFIIANIIEFSFYWSNSLLRFKKSICLLKFFKKVQTKRNLTTTISNPSNFKSRAIIKTLKEEISTVFGFIINHYQVFHTGIWNYPLVFDLAIYSSGWPNPTIEQAWIQLMT